jgi:dTDP-4-dehydrorhamnose 3,5-epimerase
MIFKETALKGAYVIELERLEDSRGFFARSYCGREFERHGLNPKLVQCNISYNRKKGTLRGMHFQAAPYEEAKLVRCTRGSIHDVIVDLRTDSTTYLENFGIRLSEKNRSMLFIPEGFAHGFITLEDDTEVFYQMSEFYAPDSARGFRWNDPAFGISWPETVRVISDRDREYPDFVTSMNTTQNIMEKK